MITPKAMYINAISKQVLGQHRIHKRNMTAIAPSADPLELFKKKSSKRMLCEGESGYRVPGAHFACNVAFNRDDETKAPCLRTVGIQRVSKLGIDLITKKNDLITGPASISYVSGNYSPGEHIEQWRAEGHCRVIPLSNVIKHVPHYSIVGMVASARARKLDDSGIDEKTGRKAMGVQSDFLDLVQSTRIDLENEHVSDDEIDDAIQAIRFLPDRMEYMYGGPDKITWDRWEWSRLQKEVTPDEQLYWHTVTHLLPY